MAERKFTDLELERHLASDLPAQREKELEEQATPADRARLAELRGEHEAFLRSVDVDMEVKRIQQRVARNAPEKRAWWRVLVPAGALAAAAAVILVFMRRSDDPKKIDDDIQVKGDEISLTVHVATGADSRRLASGDTVMPGDKIRFEISAGRPGYIAVIGIDGSGEPQVYHPGNGTGPAAYDPGARLLPGAIALDATPGDERFIAVYAAKPFAFDVVLPAIAGSGELPDGVSKSEVVLHKGNK